MDRIKSCIAGVEERVERSQVAVAGTLEVVKALERVVVRVEVWYSILSARREGEADGRGRERVLEGGGVRGPGAAGVRAFEGSVSDLKPEELLINQLCVEKRRKTTAITITTMIIMTRPKRIRGEKNIPLSFQLLPRLQRLPSTLRFLLFHHTHTPALALHGRVPPQYLVITR